MKTKHKLFFSFLFTFFLITFILWNRVIRVRLPKDLTLVNNTFFNISIISGLTVIFIGLNIYYSLRWFKILPKKNSKLSKIIDIITAFLTQYLWYNKLVAFVDTHVFNGPFNTFEYFYQFVDIRYYVSRIQEFMVYQLNLYRRKLYVIIFIFLRLSIALVFFVEVIYFKQIIYFYKLLILLLIPLLSKFILFFTKYNAMSNIDYFEEFFDFEYEDENLRFLTIKKKDLTNEKLIKECENFDTTRTVKLYHFYQQVYRFVYFAQEDIKDNKYWVNSLYYGLMGISFFFYLLIILNYY